MAAVSPVGGVLLGFAVLAVLGGGLLVLARVNRALLWGFLLAISLHLGVAGILLAASRSRTDTDRTTPPTVVVQVTPQPIPPPPSRLEPVKPNPIKSTLTHPRPHDDANRQRLHGLPNTATSEEPNGGGHPTVGKENPITTPSPVPADFGIKNPKDIDLSGPGDDPRDDFHWRQGPGGTGPGIGPGSGPGTPGHGKGGDGVKDEGGRVYFLRLKFGAGAWNAYEDGIQRLLAYLNHYFRCEDASHAVTAEELGERYLKHGNAPSFLYLYCDADFNLSAGEASVLRGYLRQGGFLFIDSRPDPFIKAQVAQQLARVVPGAALEPIAARHPINSILFRLPAPGVGENIIDLRNYGIVRDGRLVVFYTMGNFAHLYATAPPTGDTYVTAQYQMGANVMVYAINRGKSDGLETRQGANSRISTQAIQKLFDEVPAPAAPVPVAPKPAPSGPPPEEPTDVPLEP